MLYLIYINLKIYFLIILTDRYNYVCINKKKFTNRIILFDPVNLV